MYRRVEGGWCILEQREDGVSQSRGRMVCLRVEGGCMVCLRVEGGWCILEQREDGVSQSRGRMVCLRKNACLIEQREDGALEGGWCALQQSVQHKESFHKYSLDRFCFCTHYTYSLLVYTQGPKPAQVKYAIIEPLYTACLCTYSTQEFTLQYLQSHDQALTTLSFEQRRKAQ